MKSLAEKEPTFTEISQFLSESVRCLLCGNHSRNLKLTTVACYRNRFRVACQNAILLDFEAARANNVETRLWDAHLKINTRFRKLLARVSARTRSSTSHTSQRLPRYSDAVSRGKWKEKETGGKEEARKTLPRVHQIQPEILPGIHPTTVVTFWGHRGTREGCAEVQL